MARLLRFERRHSHYVGEIAPLAFRLIISRQSRVSRVLPDRVVTCALGFRRVLRPPFLVVLALVA
eukprot:2826211-Pyramimonas_sp.AAC.1